MMKKVALAVALLAGCRLLVFAQLDNPRLAILPFAGEDGEAITALLSGRWEILSAFDVVPLPAENGASPAWQRLRAGAFVDSDLAAEVGRMVGADYVLWGNTRRLGSENLVVAAVICAGSLELVAGYYRIYGTIEEAREFMPSMSWGLVYATLARPALGSLPRLAISPYVMASDPGAFRFPYGDGAGTHDKETLAQILAIEIARTGAYAVLPRSSLMQTTLRAWEARVIAERVAELERLLGLLVWLLDIQDEEILETLGARHESAAERVVALETLAVTISNMLGAQPETPENDATGAIQEIARAAGADIVLSAETRSNEGATAFAALVLCAEGGERLNGARGSYRAIDGGVSMMAHVAALLTGREARAVGPAPLPPARVWPLLPGVGVPAPMLEDSSRFWSVGAAVGTSFNDPWLIGTLQGTVAPLPFSFARIGIDLGFISGIEGDAGRAGYFSAHPFVLLAFFYPFDRLPVPLTRGGVYAGVGGGVQIARYTFGDYTENMNTPTVDFTVGLNIGNMLDVSYTLRTNFALFSSKLSVGFTHRLGAR